MTKPVEISFAPDDDLDAIAALSGCVVIVADQDGKLDRLGRRVKKLTKGALDRLLESERFKKLEVTDALSLPWPQGMAADEVKVLKLAKKFTPINARKGGACLGRSIPKAGMTLLLGAHVNASEILHGLALRAYSFTDHKTPPDGAEAHEPQPPVTAFVSNPEEASSAAIAHAARVEGVFFTRDLVNEPANVLGTEDFAARLGAMGELGLDVEILDEPELEKLGMRALLGVGLGSATPSKVVVMRWMNGGDADTLALIGKGVVFDTGGISIKPSAGMEDMTMDMGGAGVVAGVMRTLALRRAKANVVGLVGLVENMPDGLAQRPGDVVRSMKGDTIEIINTDAEGRLVLADVMWYAQETFKPAAMIDLATLTGAMLVALGHDHAGAFSNNDKLVENFLDAAKAEGERAWRMPLHTSYRRLIKSRIADVKNVGGRKAGAITAAEFLQRFVKDNTPWIHLDIAGTASNPAATSYAPAGATGWGVAALDRLVRDKFET